jgi:hypothetical protein
MKLAFYKGKAGLFDRLIRWWTKSPYSHVELLFDDGQMIAARDSTGVTIIQVASLDLNEWDVVRFDLSIDRMLAIHVWCITEIGCKYDWLGLFYSQVLRIPRSHPRKWFCSEFCVAALQRAELLRDVVPCTVSPGKLHDLLAAFAPPSMAKQS